MESWQRASNASSAQRAPPAPPASAPAGLQKIFDAHEGLAALANLGQLCSQSSVVVQNGAAAGLIARVQGLGKKPCISACKLYVSPDHHSLKYFACRASCQRFQCCYS